MKCNAMVVYSERRKKGSGQPYQKITRCYAYSLYRDNPDMVEKEAVLCDGNIKATIAAIDEPDWGYTHAELSIEYVCDKCGNQAFADLPLIAEELSLFVTKVIETMTDEMRDEVLDVRKKMREEFLYRGINKEKNEE